MEKVCDGRWEVRSRRDGLVEENEVFDGVVVCSGHYTEPRVAEIPGILLVFALFLACYGLKLPVFLSKFLFRLFSF